ncbi:DUF5658 family protein [Roseimaritima ulvae]|uniref:Uncharacterized protein n=1 Tax=Roseimaritima ulvae TaxID=980254 RepID=A0A5B9QZ97_9BACT|nr:DUF5658 family protein [Roseimaritima ulvae]QEG39313.1 hypothetical protein UC8_12780 [Roseimaritima ulvae]
MDLVSTRCTLFTRMMTAILLAGLLTSSLSAQSGRYGRGDRESDTPIESELGYLFVDGTYLPPPYKIEADYEQELIHINGTEYSADAFDLSGYTNRGFGMRGERGSWRFGGRGPRRERGESSPAFPTSSSLQALVREIGSLQHGGFVILQSERPPMVLWTGQNGHELLETLIATETEPRDTLAIPSSLESRSKETWQELVDQFQATPAFLERATADVEKVHAAIDSNRIVANAVVWSERLSYPLTMFGLVLVVIAFGHLLINAQPMFFDVEEPKAMAHVKKATVVCLLMVGLMSAIDLTWTLLASQQGSMRELNPLGNQFISDASKLVLFKTVLTVTSLGLLFWFRHLPIARRASWWCCLVLTLLTARWLTFHSLLV